MEWWSGGVMEWGSDEGPPPCPYPHLETLHRFHPAGGLMGQDEGLLCLANNRPQYLLVDTLQELGSRRTTASRACRMVSGCGGQPGTKTSTGSTAATPL